MGQGVLLAFCRCREPVYNYMIRVELRSWFGWTSEEQKKTKDDLSNQSAYSLMIQQLCTDLVYTILYTVTKHTVGIKKEGRWTVYQGYDFTNKNKFLIETMLVKSSFFKEAKKLDKSAEQTAGADADSVPTEGEINPKTLQVGINDSMVDEDQKPFKSMFDKLEEKQRETLVSLMRDRRTTEKRIEDFDLGRMLGPKFQQKYMRKMIDNEG